MSNLRKLTIILAVIVGIITLFAVMTVLRGDYREFPKVFYEYKEKGKDSQATLEDINKGFK